MTQKFTAEEVREKAHGYSLRGDSRTAAMLDTLANRIEADERAVPVASPWPNLFLFSANRESSVQAPLYRKGWDDTSIWPDDAPDAEPDAAGSGRELVGMLHVVEDIESQYGVSAAFGYSDSVGGLAPGDYECFIFPAALAARGQGEAVAWQWKRRPEDYADEWRECGKGIFDTVRRAKDSPWIVRELFNHPPASPAGVPDGSAEIVRRMTAAMREADESFLRVGGSTRHHVRDCLLPILGKHGLCLCTIAAAAPSEGDGGAE